MLFHPLQKGCGPTLSWLRWGILGGFFFLLLPCVFAVQALALFADSPSVLPYVCHQDSRLSHAQGAHWSEHCLMHLPAPGWDRPLQVPLAPGSECLRVVTVAR